MRSRLCLFPILLLSTISSTVVAAQLPATAQATVPRLVNFSGKVGGMEGNAASTVGITFAIYKDQTDGVPLWLETQTLAIDVRGNYAASLGATRPEGLPIDLFSNGDARWLGVRVNGGEEQSRVLLISVPYALKAEDAATLGGLPPSAFMLANASGSVPASAAVAAASSPSTPGTVPDVTTSGGTVDTLPLFTTGTNIQNSAVTQTSGGAAAKIGIATSAPAATLDVKGTETVRGVLTLPAKNLATSAKGGNSEPLSLVASSYNSSTAAPVNEYFNWQAESAANNTKTPSATLNLLFGAAGSTPVETGFKISSTGLMSFAKGQIFPGAGTVNSVALSAPASDFKIAGVPVTGSGTLGFDWNIAPTNAATANAIVKRDTSGSFNGGAIAASLGVTAMSSGTAAVSGANSSNGYGVLGTSSFGVAIWGESSGVSAGATGPDGVHGVTHSDQGSGVAGLNTAEGGVGIYGQGIAYGVYGQAAIDGQLLPRGTGVYGTSFAGAGVAGTSSQGPGVSGTSTAGPAFSAVGNVQQDRGSGGWVKAMMYVNGSTPPYEIVRCFNSTLTGSLATTPPCGFGLVEDQIGIYTNDFGFKISDRFILASQDVATDVGIVLSTQTAGSTQVFVSCYNGGHFSPCSYYLFAF
jgi:hypothetical protein